MHDFNKKLAAAGAAAALMAVIGVAWAQTPLPDDPRDTPAASPGDTGGPHIMRFADQGNSPETDPSAHLLLIKDAPMRAAVVDTTANTTVADATPAPVDNTPAPAPAASDTTSTTTTDTAPATTDNSAAMPAPRADRN